MDLLLRASQDMDHLRKDMGRPPQGSQVMDHPHKVSQAMDHPHKVSQAMDHPHKVSQAMDLLKANQDMDHHPKDMDHLRDKLLLHRDTNREEDISGWLALKDCLVAHLV